MHMYAVSKNSFDFILFSHFYQELYVSVCSCWSRAISSRSYGLIGKITVILSKTYSSVLVLPFGAFFASVAVRLHGTLTSHHA